LVRRLRRDYRRLGDGQGSKESKEQRDGANLHRQAGVSQPGNEIDFLKIPVPRIPSRRLWEPLIEVHQCFAEPSA
jgi:hypothetical protein